MTALSTDRLVDQPTARPTRKVTAATIGAAAGAALVSLGQAAAAQSPWLGWIGTAQMAVVLTAMGSGLGAGIAGYFLRERAP